MQSRLLQTLVSIGAIQIRHFFLEGVGEVPIVLDMKPIYAHLEVLNSICHSLWERAKDFSYTVLCGTPYESLPFVVTMSSKYRIPQLMKAKKCKKEGFLVGKFRSGQQCLLIHGVMTSGEDVIENIEDLESEGLVVQGVVSIFDFELEKPYLEGIVTSSVFTISALAKALLAQECLNPEENVLIKQFVEKGYRCLGAKASV